MRLLSLLAVLVALGLTMPSLAMADCAGHETTASTPAPETVAGLPTQSTVDTTKTTTTTQPGG